MAGEVPAIPPLPSLSSLTMNATPTGSLGRATAADVDELVAVLTAQRAQPQGARAFEGDNDSLDRLLRSAVVWQGGEAPPGDRATADDIQIELVDFLTFDKNLFAQDVTASRLIEEAILWFEEVRPPRDGGVVMGGDTVIRLVLPVQQLEEQEARIRTWRRTIVDVLEDWWTDGVTAGRIRRGNSLPTEVAMFANLRRNGISAFALVETFVFILVHNDAHLFEGELEELARNDPVVQPLIQAAKRKLRDAIVASVEYRAFDTYFTRYLPHMRPFDLTEFLLDKGIDGTLWILSRFHESEERRIINSEDPRLPPWADRHDYEEEDARIEDMMRDHDVGQPEILARLLRLIEELTPAPPPTFTLEEFPPLSTLRVN